MKDSNNSLNNIFLKQKIGLVAGPAAALAVWLFVDTWIRKMSQ